MTRPFCVPGHTGGCDPQDPRRSHCLFFLRGCLSGPRPCGFGGYSSRCFSSTSVRIFRAFAPLGLTRDGYHTPRNWGPAQLQALQAGYEQGQQQLQSFIASGINTTRSTNYWKILNTIIGDNYGFNSQRQLVSAADNTQDCTPGTPACVWRLLFYNWGGGATGAYVHLTAPTAPGNCTNDMITIKATPMQSNTYQNILDGAWMNIDGGM